MGPKVAKATKWSCSDEAARSTDVEQGGQGQERRRPPWCGETDLGSHGAGVSSRVVVVVPKCAGERSRWHTDRRGDQGQKPRDDDDDVAQVHLQGVDQDLLLLLVCSCLVCPRTCARRISCMHACQR